ncbi:MAG TPA: mycofactocin-coupled SDR family oxidoreductase [Baekduia sp.]|nr:mycofactocin-coupled SDR family oxidoreductase [Baekduia sp.]
MGQLDGKVAFITGGGRGQGRSHAIMLAQEGADIAFCDVRLQYHTIPYAMNSDGDMEQTVQLVEALGRRCLAVEADVRDSAQVESAVERVIEELGQIDILCANAGIWAPAQIVEMEDELWHDVIETNLSGAFYAMRAVGRHMRERGAGRIVVTSSMCGRQGTQNLGAYCASKWGVIGLVKTAAIELGPYDVAVNAVCPTMVDTPMIVNEVLDGMFRPDLEAPTRETSEEVVRAAMHKLPVGYYGPEEISKAVLFLVSDQARYITGSALDVSAGKATEWSA